MKITGIHQSTGSRPVREAVYSGVYSLREYQAYRKDSGNEDFLKEEQKLVDMNQSRSAYLKDEALKVALIHRRYQRVCNLLLKIANNPGLLKEEFVASDDPGTLIPNGLYGLCDFSGNTPRLLLSKAFASMKTCLPAGVITDDEEHQTCNLYQLCPWCRYRVATDIYRRLRPMLSRSRKIVVSGFCDADIAPDSDHEAANDERRLLIKRWRKKNKLIGGVTVTLPDWHALHDTSDPGASPSYSLFFNTFIIAVADGSTNLKALHHCTTSTSEEIYTMAMLMPQWQANASGLQNALGYVMKYPVQLLTTRHAATFASEVETVLNARSALGRSPFGGARRRND